MAFVQILLGLSAFMCFFSLSFYALAAALKNKEILFANVDSKTSPLKLKYKILCGFAVVGLFICIYQGVEAMLFFLPEGWGEHDEYGDFIPVKETIAFISCTYIGLPLLAFIAEASEKMGRYEWLLLQNKEFRKIIEAADSRYAIETLKDRYLEEIEAMKGNVRSLDESIKFNAYNELLHLVNKKTLKSEV